jgi:hypothetical protein
MSDLLPEEEELRKTELEIAARKEEFERQRTEQRKLEIEFTKKQIQLEKASAVTSNNNTMADLDEATGEEDQTDDDKDEREEMLTRLEIQIALNQADNEKRQRLKPIKGPSTFKKDDDVSNRIVWKVLEILLACPHCSSTIVDDRAATVWKWIFNRISIAHDLP